MVQFRSSQDNYYSMFFSSFQYKHSIQYDIMDCQPHNMKDKYILAHVVASLVYRKKSKQHSLQSKEDSKDKGVEKVEIGINIVIHVQNTLLTHWITDISNHYQNIMCLTEVQDQLLPYWSAHHYYIPNQTPSFITHKFNTLTLLS